MVFVLYINRVEILFRLVTNKLYSVILELINVGTKLKVQLTLV
jgi:hypothetical protein